MDSPEPATTSPGPVLTIERLAAGGEGIGHLHGKVLFVRDALPGDRVEVHIERDQGRFAHARVLKLLEASPLRRALPCSLALECGGCPWMALPPAEQNRARQALVVELMARVGGLQRSQIRPMLEAPHELEYRNRLRLWAEGGQLGFRRRNSHLLVDVPRCEVAMPALNQALLALRLALAPHLPDLRFPLQIELQCSEAQHLELAISGLEASRFQALVLELPGQEQALRPHIDASRLELNSAPRLPFLQANPEQNRRMVALASDALAVSSSSHVLDLYCGAGNFSRPLLGRVEVLLGMEANLEAIARARQGAEDWRAMDPPPPGLIPTRARYEAVDVVAGVQALLRAGRTFDRVLLDPPRSGAKELCRLLPRLKPARVVYVSCDPATLARDLKVLSAGGFAVSWVQPIELMPQTAHVECVALLERVL